MKAALLHMDGLPTAKLATKKLHLVWISTFGYSKFLYFYYFINVEVIAFWYNYF